MDLALPDLWFWTVLVFVLTLTWFHVANRSKKRTKLADTTVEERRDGDADVIIVGAGVGGSALVYALAKDGRRVHVIERDMREPERLMGELMQPGGRFMLAKLGLEDCLEGIDEQKATGLALYKDGKEAFLLFPASSLSNVRLEEGTVNSLIEEKGVIKGVTYKTRVGQETTAFAPLTVAEILSYGVGYISKNCRLEEPETVHLIMSKPTFTMMNGGSIKLAEVRCVSEVSPDNVPSISNGDMATYFKKIIAAQIPPKLREIYMKGINDGAKMKVVATKNMWAMLSKKKGVIVLGDAFNMRHPVIASGMMVLLSDILILRSLLKPLSNLSDANKVSEILEYFYNILKPMSATVNTLGSAFSQMLVASTDEAKEALRQGFFDYLCGSGLRKSEVMALLGGMNPQPLSLIRQLFAMTLSSVGQLLSPFPFPLRIWHSVKLLGLALKMLGPHLKAEGVWQMLSPANAAAYRKKIMAANTS
ncbi:hypothetical protein AALP_AA8G417000 [Arabis alpina]|uniref:Squalene monooxygenase n=1 Tax=Arabis alpina TaxID=50452 RepID=A0A087GCU7_ARAAL|nr:hypothetical protein AALP_AA8G417000 [Arabis alpina]